MNNQERAEQINDGIAQAIGAVRANGSYPTLSFVDTIRAALDKKDAYAERLKMQALEISETLRGAGVGPCTLPNGVRVMAQELEEKDAENTRLTALLDERRLQLGALVNELARGGTVRPKPSIELESASQFRRVAVMEGQADLKGERFAEQYAARSGVTVETLRQLGQEARPCVCEEADCPGWQMASVEGKDLTTNEVSSVDDLRVIVTHPFLALAREFAWDDRQLAVAQDLIDVTLIRLEEAIANARFEERERI